MDIYFPHIETSFNPLLIEAEVQDMLQFMWLIHVPWGNQVICKPNIFFPYGSLLDKCLCKQNILF